MRLFKISLTIVGMAILAQNINAEAGNTLPLQKSIGHVSLKDITGIEWKDTTLYNISNSYKQIGLNTIAGVKGFFTSIAQVHNDKIDASIGIIKKEGTIVLPGNGLSNVTLENNSIPAVVNPEKSLKSTLGNIFAPFEKAITFLDSFIEKNLKTSVLLYIAALILFIYCMKKSAQKKNKHKELPFRLSEDKYVREYQIRSYLDLF